MAATPPSFTRAPAQLVRGFCMGAADIVPGVSGGTVALLLGIYEALVANIRQAARGGVAFLRLDLRDGFRRLAAVDWLFLLPLLVGIGAAVVSLSATIEHLLEVRPVQMASVFFGLVAASIAVAWSHLGERDAVRLGVLALSAVATFWLLGLRSARVEDPALWVAFGAGAIAICAMILPGISGSFLLLMMGLYEAVLGAVNDRDVVLLAVFAAGCVLGLAAFSSLLDWLLRHHHGTVLAGLIGLMAGSLRVLWPWPAGTENAALAAPPAGEWLVPLGLAAVSAVVVLGVAGLGVNRQRAQAAAAR